MTDGDMRPLDNTLWLDRREFLGKMGTGLGSIALACLLAEEASAATPPSLARNERAGKGVGGLGHFGSASAPILAAGLPGFRRRSPCSASRKSGSLP